MPGAICFAGGLGGGKTLSMVMHLVRMFRDGDVRQVYTNMQGLKCPEAIYVDHVDQLIGLTEGILALDEAGIIFPAQFWQEQGRDMLESLMQVRKHGLDMLITAQRGPEGLNVSMRTIVNQTVWCRRVGPWISQRLETPSSRQAGKGKFVKIDPAIYGLYDTLEVIAHTGGSKGTAQRVQLSTAARKRSEHRRAQAAQSALKNRQSLLTYGFAGMFWRPGEGSRHLGLSSEAASALSWLRENGHYDDRVDMYDGMPLVDWHDQIRRELIRRRWLAQWGLKPEDAPVTCTPENPWLEGYEPLIVKEQRREVELMQSAERLVAAAEAVNRGRRRPSHA